MNRYTLSIVQETGMSESKDPPKLTLWLRMNYKENFVELMATRQDGFEQIVALVWGEVGQVVTIPNMLLEEFFNKGGQRG